MNNAIYPGQWRLEKIELANWGTFSGLHQIDVPRKGFLLTGESGSGKSSVVDAISAVLTPRGKTRFNAAAADTATGSSDRSVLTYVRGAFKRSADEETGEITSQYLRPKATWSGILLRYNNGKGQLQTLVKLFHIKTGENTPADVKDVSLLVGDALGLAQMEPFAANGLKTRELKAAFPEASVDGEHSRFARRVARVLGLSGERAALLLHKTQSAKNLGSLDELFRKFMLDEPDTFAKADAAVDQFTELKAAHEAVLRARHQVEHLKPLRAQNTEFEEAEQQADHVAVLLDSLDDFTHLWRQELTASAIDDAKSLYAKKHRELQKAEDDLSSATGRAETFHAQVEQRGGMQLSLVESKISSAKESLKLVEKNSADINRKLGDVMMATPGDATQFDELSQACARLLDNDASEKQQLEEALNTATAERIIAEEALAEVQRDMKALRDNRSNLPRDLLAARAAICQDTGLDPNTLRFAGELLQVLPEFSDWSGAIERVLRPLALVMLVPAAHELTVAKAVNARHLGTSLRYESIGRQTSAPKRAMAANSLVHRVEVAQSPMSSWLEARLAERFDFSCVDSVEQLQEVTQGVTQAGQVKRGPRSFEKNDRHGVNDQRYWVLGFDTDAKLEQLQVARQDAQRQVDALLKTENRARSALNLHNSRIFVAGDIVRMDWEQLDVLRAQQRVEDLEKSLATLLADDSDLRAAQHQLHLAKEELEAAKVAQRNAQMSEVTAQSALESLEKSLAALQERKLSPIPAETTAALKSEFASVRTKRATTHETIETEARGVLTALSKRKEALRNTMATLHQLMQRVITSFKQTWPESAQDLADDVQDRQGYLQVLSSLEADRLPEFEDRFFDMLRTQTQQNIAQLRERIQRATREIRQRIDPINASLLRSFYSPGHYLQIRVEDARPAMASDFLRDLNTVTTGALAPEEDRAEAEARFAVLARLMYQLGSSESAHRSWRHQVLDVRNHVKFTAVEVDSDRQVMDVYDSGAGRSGGQKQKLVVFCLAAALRYQLADGNRLPDYGSIVMDEAFDKADTKFTKTAMDIFTEFGFHMILATPMKLLRTLEDYVGGVALVSCEDSRRSSVAEVPFDMPEQEKAPSQKLEEHDDNQEPQSLF